MIELISPIGCILSRKFKGQIDTISLWRYLLNATQLRGINKQHHVEVMNSKIKFYDDDSSSSDEDGLDP